MKYSSSYRVFLQMVLLLFGICVATSNNVYVPDQLKPWTRWIEEKNPTMYCIPTSPSEQPVCAWGGKLVLEVDNGGARFSQKWTVLAECFLSLPGDTTSWPRDVTVNRKKATVISRTGVPVLYLKKGVYTISGKITWSRIPESLHLPVEIAVITLFVNRSKVEFPNRDHHGTLWFGTAQQARTAKPEQDRVEVQVYRKIVDGEPLTIHSRLHLSVAGKARELLIGKYLPDNTVPLLLQSPLPARIEKNGYLRIQVKPGSYQVVLESRQRYNSDTIKVSGRNKPWPEEEVWSFESNNNIRVVKIHGAGQLDPSQTSMPEEWKRLPAYLVPHGTSLVLQEEHRGNWSPAPDELTLQRELWLDFDGTGYTFKDELSGVIARSKRLSFDRDVTPGAVTLNGEPQLITTADSMWKGLEVAFGPVQVKALGRYQKREARLSLSGWRHNVSHVTTTLHLPPGWRLFHAGGVSRVTDSWIGSWNLWELFLILILVVSLVKLIGIIWGVVALVTFVCTFHEAGAPVYSWAVVTILAALLKVIPSNRFKRVLSICMYVALTGIAAMVLTFAVKNFRQAIYPQMEHPYRLTLDNWYEEEQMVDEEMVQAEPLAMKEAIPSPELKRKRGRYGSIVTQQKIPYEAQRARKTLDVQAKIQTGPGEPLWNWNEIRWNSGGPVVAGQSMTLVLIPPLISRMLSVVNPFLLLVMLFCFLINTVSGRYRRAIINRLTGRAGAVASAAFFLILCPFPVRADFPPPALLDDLEKRMLADPPCGNDCAAMTEGQVSVGGNHLKIVLVIHAQRRQAFAIPGSPTGWLPAAVTLSGKDDPPVYRNGNHLYVLINMGINHLVLRGQLSEERVQIPFPFTVRNLTFRSPEWTAQGIVDGTLPGRSITLEKITRGTATVTEEKKLLPDPEPLFCKVQRVMTIDKEWSLETSVLRVAPMKGALSLTIPLVHGEAIITDGIQVVNDSAKVLIPDGETTILWKSRLEKKSSILLQAAKTDFWRESWVINSTTRWHVETEGLIPIKESEQIEGEEWLPRPGETLKVTIGRPKPVDGPTKTIQQVSITHTPGKRSSESTMLLTVKSSRGDKAHVTLPKNAELKKVEIDGMEKVISHQNGLLDIPLHPGNQQIALEWKENRGIGILWSTPVPMLEEPATNIELEMSIPATRWPLFVTGPRIGPAMLLWGILLVLVCAALLLGRTSLTPLKSRHWILIFIGLSTVNNLGGLFIVLWMVLFTLRERYGHAVPERFFNGMQSLLILATVVALFSLISAIPFGLLSLPDMQITGNGSTGRVLNWYQDAAKAGTLPKGWLLSLPLWVYRLVMLAWSLWLAVSLPGWLKWAWNIFRRDELWKQKKKNVEEPLVERKVGKKTKKIKG